MTPDTELALRYADDSIASMWDRGADDATRQLCALDAQARAMIALVRETARVAEALEGILQKLDVLATVALAGPR